MCLPLIGLIGTAVSAAGSIMGGQMAAAQGKAQDEALRRQARIEREAGEYQAGRRQDEIDRTMSNQVALGAASGLTLEGSPMDALASSASEGALDTGAIRWGAKNKADNLEFEGKMARQRGNNARIGSYFSAAGDLFGGLGTLGKTYLGNLNGGY